jgi:four helix bundle protein
MAHNVEDLPVYQAAQKLACAVDAILERPGLRRNRLLHDQLSDANDSVTSNIAEGFDQPTDKAFSAFLFHSKASVREVRTRLGIAHRKKYITKAELDNCLTLAESVGKQLGGFIKYLAESDFTDRGRFKEGKPRDSRNPRLKDPGLKEPGLKDRRLKDPGSRDPGSKDQG